MSERRPESRRGRVRSPWARKRWRIGMLLALCALCLLPLLYWRAQLTADVRASLEAVEARGEPVTFADLEARLPQVHETENAALLYLEAARLFQELPADSRAALPFLGETRVSPTAPLTPAQRGAIQSLMDHNTAVRASLREAASLPAARYVRDYGRLAVDMSHLETVRLLLQFCNPNAASNDGLTPMHWACIAGHVEVAQLLAACGGDPWFRDEYIDGLTPIKLAAIMGHESLSQGLSGQRHCA